MNLISIFKHVTVVGAILFSSSCARQISSNVYSGGAVGEVSSTYAGTIISARVVTIQDQEYLENNGLGLVGGGVGGAILGSQVGKGRGNTAATIAGGILGATAGAFAEQNLKSQNAMEYVVQLENGEAKTVVQGPEPQLGVGQRVWLMSSHQGRSRIVPRQ